MGYLDITTDTNTNEESASDALSSFVSSCSSDILLNISLIRTDYFSAHIYSTNVHYI